MLSQPQPQNLELIADYIKLHLVVIETARIEAETVEFELLNPYPELNLLIDDFHYIGQHLDNRQYFLYTPTFSDAIECKKEEIYATALKLLGMSMEAH